MSRRMLSRMLATFVLLALPGWSGAGEVESTTSHFNRTSAADKPEPLCEEFRKLLRIRGGLSPYELELDPDSDGNVRINNIDVDGDGAVDELLWWCPGSASIIPPDHCTLTITLSFGKKVEFEESRFSLMRYASRVYAVAQDFSQVNLDNPNPDDIKTKFYRVDGSGVHLICSKLP